MTTIRGLLLISLCGFLSAMAQPRPELPAAGVPPRGQTLFAPSNLLAWCIVPYDQKQRTPAERIAMLQRLGFTQYASGEIRPISAVLWLLLFLFFASGVFYVRMRIHGLVAERKGVIAGSNPGRWPCALYHAVLTMVVPVFFLARVIPWPVLLAFAPAVWRAAAALNRHEARLDLRRLGWSEVAVATAFVLILIAAFRFTLPAG